MKFSTSYIHETAMIEDGALNVVKGFTRAINLNVVFSEINTMCLEIHV